MTAEIKGFLGDCFERTPEFGPGADHFIRQIDATERTSFVDDAAREDAIVDRGIAKKDAVGHRAVLDVAIGSDRNAAVEFRSRIDVRAGVDHARVADNVAVRVQIRRKGSDVAP